MSEITFTETKIKRNRVSILISKMGFKPEPSYEKLKELNITMHRFNKIIENSVEMSSSEMFGFAKWLNVDIQELFENQ